MNVLSFLDVLTFLDEWGMECKVGYYLCIFVTFLMDLSTCSCFVVDFVFELPILAS
jgi:hypothetical protein